MNIEQAKAIPIAKILEKLNRTPIRNSGNQSWYITPWRDEKTASLHVHDKNNWWYDFGIGIGGNSVSLVVHHLKMTREAYTISDALRWLDNMLGEVPTHNSTFSTPRKEQKEYKLKLISAGEIEHPALCNYLQKRGIPMTVARSVLKEVKSRNIDTGKMIFALGLLNEEGSYELRNPLMKSCVGTKAISFIRGQEPKPRGLHIFEGFMDYLSIITQNNGKKFKDDTIILNSLSCIKQITAYIKGYGYQTIYSWFDNDQAGKKATLVIEENCKSEEGLLHKPMNKTYEPFKDVNAWHMHKLEL